MRVIVSGRGRIFRAPVVICAAIVLVAVVAVFLFTRGGADEVTATQPDTILEAAKTEVDTGAAAVSAVLSTLENYGARDADEAISIWADGVAAKNGVTQYSVMSADLKEKYVEVVGKNQGGALLFPSSANQIDSWYVSELIDNDDGSQVAKLSFTLGEVVAAAELTIVPEGEFAVVSSVAVETPLYEFTGIG